MRSRSHYELVFIASRMGLSVMQACSGNQSEILQEICNRCRTGTVCDIWGVHAGGICVMGTYSDHNCRVKRLQDMVESQGEYVRRFDNSTTPFERDYLVYILAKRTNQLEVVMENHLMMTKTCCLLCREGAKVDIDPLIHNNGDCLGGYVESDGRIESNLEKQCWVHRFWYWCHDPTRMEREYELV